MIEPSLAWPHLSDQASQVATEMTLRNLEHKEGYHVFFWYHPSPRSLPHKTHGYHLFFILILFMTSYIDWWGVVVGAPKMTQLCTTTRHVVSCDWWENVYGLCRDTPSLITTRHMASYGTRLCHFQWSQHFPLMRDTCNGLDLKDIINY